MNYTNREVVRRLKQYDMFLNSLNLATNEVQRERICDQLDKIEKQILLETNNEYEDKYMILLGEEARFFSEEKERLNKLISLIVDRKKYLEDRKLKHKNVTGSLVELTTFLGEDKLSVFRRRLEIIEKYEQNKVRQENIVREMKTLDIKLSEASRIVKANTRLNDILENKMKDVIGKALDKLNLYSLVNKRSDILRNHETIEYAFNMAKSNLKSAKGIGEEEVILECDEMLSEMATEYSKSTEKVSILKLIDIYDITANGYDELLEKRDKINDILKSISDSELYNEIADELNKEYNTIKLEKQDIENYESLKEQREINNKKLYDIDEENNSKEFKSVIDELLKNENRIREERVRQAKKEEYQERQKKLIEEQKIEASRVRRQKLIEEARLKEQQERLKKVKELQDKTVINSKKEEVISKKVDITPKVEDKVVISKENKEEKFNNPLKNKTLEETISFDNEFDTDELFENTKIVPNKVLNSEKSLFDNIQSSELDKKVETEKNLEDTILAEAEASIPVWGEPTSDEVIDLFKEEEPKVEEVVVGEKEEKIEIKEELPKESAEIVEEVEEEKREPSIYDILENNKNIIWKTTESNVNKNSIPVIGNNNLRPQVLDSREVGNTAFPKLENNKGKEGEILWKETL